tara:strand:- start:80 stop:334 length:255 start_codon:yes stop_codon:yes gene_type:complete
MVPDSPTETYSFVLTVVLSEEVVSSSEVVEDELSLEEELPSPPQEIIVIPKRNIEKIINICLIGFLLVVLENLTYTKTWGILQE